MPTPRGTEDRRFVAPVLATLVVAAAVLTIAALFPPWEIGIGNVVLRAQRGVRLSFPAPAPNESIAAPESHDVAAADEVPPQNVILMIGDGMGLGAISTASVALHGPKAGLLLESAPVTGLVKTHSGSRLTTDSAASSTAMATGFKVPNKAIAVLADGRVPVSLFEAARAAGLATGLVTTSGLMDATPGGFAAHTAAREDYSEILDDLLASGTEVLIGGDAGNHRKMRRDDALQDRIADIESLGEAAGYSVVTTGPALAVAEGRVLALFPPRSSRGNAHGPPLPESATFALDRLNATGRGFVLVVESEMTDDSGHLNHAAGVVAAVAELDATLAAVLEWTEARGDTLVLVTADHDTGGLGAVGGTYEDGVAEVRWLTVNHTATWVPLFAFGPGAEHFRGVLDNTEIGTLIAKLLGIEGFPAIRP